MVEPLVFVCAVLCSAGAHVLAETWPPGPPGLVLDWVLDVYTLTSDAVENERCRRDSATYKQAAKDGEGWALHMLDASSKVPSGLLTGNVLNLGNYDECLMVEGVFTASGRFSGQNCMVTLDATSTKLLNYSMFPSIRWSLCIPSTCTPRDLELHLRSVLQDEIGDSQLRVGDKACRSREQTTELTPGGWFAIVFFAIVAAIVVISTAYDVIMRDSDTRSALFASFSIYTNGRKLLDSPVDIYTLHAVHGMRAITIMWVLLGQTFYIHSLVSAINSNTMLPAKYDWDHLLIRNSELAPDTFLLLSGVLACYGFLRDMDTKVSFNVPFYYLHRYIRLTPAYAAMILFTATLFEHVDDGPLWGEYTAATCQSCRTNWWVGLLYLNNYIDVDSMCIRSSWFLAVSMQLYFISPLILYPLWRWPKAGKALLGVLIGVGALTSFLVVFLNKIPVNDYGWDAVAIRDIPTHMRFMPWLIGVGLGSVLHATRGVATAHSKVMLAGCSLGGGVLQLTSTLLLPLFQQPGHEYNRWFESLFTSLNKPAWALGVAWIVYACAKGYAVPIDTLLSWKVFRVLGRLAYGVYLVHVSVLLWLFGTVRTPMYLHDRTIMTNFSAVLLISFGGALVLFLVFESPAIVIEHVILVKHTENPAHQEPKKKLCDELENEELKFPDV